jgi:hypothetical protein
VEKFQTKQTIKAKKALQPFELSMRLTKKGENCSAALRANRELKICNQFHKTTLDGQYVI